MRGHFEHDIFGFPPGFGPWDRGFGAWGPGRSPFNMTDWPNFRRHSCRPHGPPDFCTPDRYGNHHLESDHGLRQRHRSPGWGRSGPPDCWGPPGFHGPPGFRRFFGPPGCHQPNEERRGHNKSHDRERRGPCQDHHENSQCHRGIPDHDHDCYGHDQGRREPPRHEDDYGPRNCSNWHDFGMDGFGPQKARTHRNRSRLYDRPSGYTEKENEARSCNICCTSNRNNHESNTNKQCGERSKEKNGTENTVLVQRIVVETTPARPSSV